MQIVVGQEHIDRANALRLDGVYPDADKCPIALALLTMGHGAFVDPIDGFIAMLNDIFTLPDSVSEWANNFDAGDEVYPFGFKLDLEGHQIPERQEQPR